MVITPSSFTYEHLSSLKFKELQKLSLQFRVNKRWAKKQELIENLLALKEKQDDEPEWRDASTVFSDLKDKNEYEGNKRLTYNVTKKSSLEHIDPHLTFEVPQHGKNLLCETINSRETYDIPPSKTVFGLELLKESRASFEIPPKQKLSGGRDSRATFEVCKNGEKLLEESTINENKNLDGVKIREDNGSEFMQDNKEIKIGKQEIKERQKKEVKMTIPCVRVTRRTKAGENCKNDNSPIKMSKKSVNIKKSTRLPVSKASLLKSPALSSVKKSINKETITQSLTKNHQSRVPIRLQFTEEKSKSADGNDKENVKRTLRGISKTATVNKKPNLTKVNVRTPPSSVTKSSKFAALKKTPFRRDPDGKLNSKLVQTPDNNKIPIRPITATKMPDFSKIHKRQFEQMDSLHDYLKKKEDRVRKLFGVPQPGQQLHNLNKSEPVFHFQSEATAVKDIKESKNLKSVPATVLKKRDNDSKVTQKEAFKGKLWTDIKDKNRSHIHGVRTNKRFALQMKFRNMLTNGAN